MNIVFAVLLALIGLMPAVSPDGEIGFGFRIDMPECTSEPCADSFYEDTVGKMTVTSFECGDIAKNAGLRLDDEITAINGTQVLKRTFYDVLQMLAEAKPGTQVTIAFKRTNAEGSVEFSTVTYAIPSQTPAGCDASGI